MTTETKPATVAADGVLYERRKELDKRIAHGDDFAGDAWVRWVAVGHVPWDSDARLTVLERDRASLIAMLRSLLDNYNLPSSEKALAATTLLSRLTAEVRE